MKNIVNFDLERRLRRYTIANLMRYIVIGQAVVFLLQFLWPVSLGPSLVYRISLNRAAVFRGEIWRLVTFVFVPLSSSPLFILFSLYFYYIIGTRLENHWGKVKFNLFYLIGMLGAIVAMLLTGWADNTLLNLSLFFAYAAIWPDEEVLLFMVLPVKMKYLALLDAVLYAWMFIRGGASTRITIILCLLNVLLFVGGDLLRLIRQDSKYWKTRRNFRRVMWKK